MSFSDLKDALKSLNVQSLRELARKQLGAGYSRLKTKSQLVSALAEGLDRSAAKGLLAKLLPRGKAQVEVAPKVAAGVRGVPPIPARPRKRGREPAPAKPTPAAKVKAIPIATTTAPAKKEPATAAIYDERLGELPDRYGDDALVALPVDPTTIFVYWDFAAATAGDAARGLPSPRSVLSVHADEEIVREVDFALESRSFYLRGLPPARTYHAEIHFVGSDGRRRRVGRPSNAVVLSPNAPSDVIDDRFVAFPWDRPGALAARDVPGVAHRDLAAAAWRGGSSMPAAMRPWLGGGQGSGQPLSGAGR